MTSILFLGIFTSIFIFGYFVHERDVEGIKEEKEMAKLFLLDIKKEIHALDLQLGLLSKISRKEKSKLISKKRENGVNYGVWKLLPTGGNRDQVGDRGVNNVDAKIRQIVAHKSSKIEGAFLVKEKLFTFVADVANKSQKYGEYIYAYKEYKPIEENLKLLVVIENVSGFHRKALTFSKNKWREVNFNSDIRGAQLASYKMSELQLSLFRKGNGFSQLSIKTPLMVLFLSLAFWAVLGLLVFKVIGQRKKVEELVQEKTMKLEESKAELEKAFSVKEQFLANVSHEVRTPLNLIIGMSDLLQKSDLGFEVKNLVKSINSAGEHLLSIIEEILESSKIDDESFCLDEKACNLPVELERVFSILYPKCRQKKIGFSWFISPHFPERIFADHTRINQVIINLVNNAIKFTETGFIRVVVDYDESDESKVKLLVEDTGSGIPKDKLEVIFDKFTQVDASSSRAKQGVGLGLSIVKTIVDKSQGKLSVKSKLQHGTQFNIELPVKVLSGSSWLKEFRGVVDERDIKSVFVCAADDIELRFLKESINHKNVEVTSTSSGREAQKILLDQADEFDYIFLDICGNDIGGLDVLDSLDLYGEHITVLLPQIHRDTDMERLQARNVQIVIKPYGIKDVFQALGWSRRKVIQEPEVHQDSKKSKKTILVAEDDLDNRLLFDLYLKKTGANVCFANDGAEALKNYESFAPDLLITDLQMPNVDGLTLVRKIRDEEAKSGLQRLPILVLSADAQKVRVEKKLGDMIDGYLTKPILQDDLLNEIEFFLLDQNKQVS